MRLAALPLVLALSVLLALGACSDANSPDAASAAIQSPGAGVPDTARAADPAILPERYQRRLERALRTADAGDKSPTLACTGLVAMVAGQARPADVAAAPEDVQAFERCYVEVGVRYIRALLAKIDAGASAEERDEICARVASFAIVTRASLGPFAQNLHLQRADLDRRLHDAVQADVGRDCPAQLELLAPER
jgi:hypothetical protein